MNPTTPTASDSRHQHICDAVLTFFLGFVLLSTLQAYYRPDALAGIHFMPWSSEFLMQTLPIEDLRAEPLKSLWYLHIQPPLLDGIRALLVWLSPRSDSTPVLVQRVDSTLSLFGIAIYSAIGALSCLWLNMTGPRWRGYVAAVVLFLHPAMLLYVSLLETTLATAFFSLLLCFSLWRLVLGRGGVAPLICAFLGAFLARSMFQWPTLVVVLVALLISRVRWRTTLTFAAWTIPLVFALTLKQWMLFQLPYTSSFAGMNFCRAIGGCEELTDAELVQAQAFLAHHPSHDAAGVLSHGKSIPHAENFNSLMQLNLSKRQLLAFRKTLKDKPLYELLTAAGNNARIYLQPSSHYASHAFLDRVAWRKAYDSFFSGATLLVSLILSAALWFWAHRNRPEAIRAALALSLPLTYIVAASILLESGENQRFKFFLEPMIVAFVISQCAALARLVYERTTMRTNVCVPVRRSDR
jgi:hypothetical protein